MIHNESERVRMNGIRETSGDERENARLKR